MVMDSQIRYAPSSFVLLFSGTRSALLCGRSLSAAFAASESPSKSNTKEEGAMLFCYNIKKEETGRSWSQVKFLECADMKRPAYIAGL
jgi:hypothetical protein